MIGETRGLFLNVKYTQCEIVIWTSGPTSGGVVIFKTGKWEVPDSNPVALVDLAIQSFQ